MARTGRPTIFPNKQRRYQGFVSAKGEACFEQARAELALLVEWPVESVSDGDTMDYLARGRRTAREHVRKRRT